MTKPRPSSFKGLTLAVAAGLTLAMAADAAWASPKQGRAPAAAKKKHGARAHPGKASKTPSPAAEVGAAEIIAGGSGGVHGRASFYGRGFQGRRTAAGDRFDSRALTGASNLFPLGTWVAVNRLDNDRCVVVRINDRMASGHGRRVIDLSRGAAQELDLIAAGVALVRVLPLAGAPRRGGSGQGCPAGNEGAVDPECPDCAGDRVPEAGESGLRLNGGSVPSWPRPGAIPRGGD